MPSQQATPRAGACDRGERRRAESCGPQISSNGTSETIKKLASGLATWRVGGRCPALVQSKPWNLPSGALSFLALDFGLALVVGHHEVQIYVIPHLFEV